MNELSIIQKVYDLIQWYVPILERLPKSHRYGLGQRMTNLMYDIFEQLLYAKYNRAGRQERLQQINIQLDILRYQTRMLKDFTLMSAERHQYVNQRLADIGNELGGWRKQITPPKKTGDPQ
ncbi:MAG: diversity-generating retroelement protein Avd [Snowella sp.]|nr:diversity-generating retroelement protein Avd [Snowella sp.]